MNIWIFNHYAQTDELPGGTRHYDLALELLKKGNEVTIFASGYHYTLLEDMVIYNQDGYKRETKKGVDFVWVKTFPYLVNNYRRLLNIITYALKLNKIIPKLNMKKPDLIIGSTVHPFAGLIALNQAKKNNVAFIFEIRDLWPQTFIDMGIWNKENLKVKFFKMIESYTVRRSDKIIVLSPLTINYLKEKYSYLEENILLLPNGINKSFIREVKQNIVENINITYLGAVDMVHGLDFLIELANKLQDEKIIFNIYGDGKQRKELENKTKEYNLKNLIWHGSVAKNMVASTLEKSNLLFVSTSNVLYGSENKLYEYMGSAKPLIIAVSANHNNPISDIECGIALNRDDIEGSAKELSKFCKKDRKDFISFGKIAQKYVINNRTIEILANKLELFLKEKNV